MTGRKLGLDDPYFYRTPKRPRSKAARKARATDKRHARRLQRARDKQELMLVAYVETLCG